MRKCPECGSTNLTYMGNKLGPEEYICDDCGAWGSYDGDECLEYTKREDYAK